MKKTRKPKLVIGWKEWGALPTLGIPAIKIKVDTGAQTSALHARDIEVFERDGARFVRFTVHPVQGTRAGAIRCEAPLVDRRSVTSSTGNRQRRYVIAADLVLAGRTHPIEITLTNRSSMQFRMLLGRTAMHDAGFIVDPQLHFQGGVLNAAAIYGLPPKSRMPGARATGTDVTGADTAGTDAIRTDATGTEGGVGKTPVKTEEADT